MSDIEHPERRGHSERCDELRAEVQRLVRAARREPGTELPAGAEGAALDAFEARWGLRLPTELREWLLTCNGSLIGPGGLFGIGTWKRFTDLEASLELVPEWRRIGWLPVAGDGCGSYFVLDLTTRCEETHPVYFVDHERGYDVPTYVVASGLWQFLRGLLEAERIEEEGGVSDWPFNAEVVLRQDPALRSYPGPAPFPWELE